MKTLHIVHDLHLPLDVIQRSMAILAVRGAGKTYTALRLAEEIFGKVPAVIVDPTGVCWGLRSSADGEKPGLPFVIMGGEHGDLPLEYTTGGVVADFIVDEHPSVVLDLSDQRKYQQIHFMAEFGERLYERKAREKSPVLVVIDEADAFAPQQIRKGVTERRSMLGPERCLGAMEDFVRRGRSRGIFPVLVSQRASVVNKDVLTQCEVLIALRTTGVQDIDALELWIKKQGGTAEQRQEFLAHLPSLPDGVAFFWWPGHFFKRAKVLQRKTFDSSATPEIGKKAVEPKTVADVDLAALQVRMSATIERTKATDPKELQKQIVALKRELATRSAEIRERQVEVHVEVPVLSEDHVRRLERAVQDLRAHSDAMGRVQGQVIETASFLIASMAKVRAVRAMARRPGDVKPEMRGPVPRSAHATMPKADAVTIGKGEFKILAAIAQYPDGITREQLTVLTGYKRSSRDTYLQHLRAVGYVAQTAANRLVPMPEGITALGDRHEPLPTGRALIEHWMGRLPEGERRIFEQVVRAYPDSVERERLSENTGYQRSSRDTYLQRLRARGLVIPDGRGAVKAAEVLF